MKHNKRVASGKWLMGQKAIATNKLSTLREKFLPLRALIAEKFFQEADNIMLLPFRIA
jgi:hypothetical protein